MSIVSGAGGSLDGQVGPGPGGEIQHSALLVLPMVPDDLILVRSIIADLQQNKYLKRIGSFVGHLRRRSSARFTTDLAAVNLC
jgi:hypothetical protein